MFKEKYGMKIVDENNLDINFLNNYYQYAEKLLIYEDVYQDGSVKRPLAYVTVEDGMIWTKFGMKQKTEVLEMMEAKKKEIKYLMDIIETDYRINHKLHKKHQNPAMAHKRKDK